MRVRYIVEGSSQKSGDEVLITVQLIDARKDNHLISRQYEKRYDDVFSLYAEIALDVAGEIRAVITPEERKTINETPSARLAATRLLIRGDDFSSLQRVDLSQNSEYIKRAESYYRKALRIDSTYADAWVQWGETLLNSGKTDSALALARKALQFEPENAKAYTLMGTAFRARRDAEAMKKSLVSAMKLDPSDPWPIIIMGGYHYYQGDFSKALESLLRTRKMIGNLQTAHSGTQLYRVHMNTLLLARFLIGMGFYDSGKQFLDEWLKLSDDDIWGYYYNLIWASIINGRYEEAYQLGLERIEQKHFYFLMDLLFMKKNAELLKYTDEFVARNKREGKEQIHLHFFFGYVYLINGQREVAEKFFSTSADYFKNLLKEHPEQKRPSAQYAIMDRYWSSPFFVLTSVASVRGEKEKALGYLRELRKNYQASDLQVVTFLKLFPMLDNIRSEPEFQDYLREAENHYLSERQKVEKLLKKEGIIQ
jgi:tetratricopeptide (TPR) repeat protein